MLTPANKLANQKLALRVKEYIRHISRRKPRPRLTISYLRACQQAYVDAISSHFVHQSQLVSMVLMAVFSNVNIISRTQLVPKAIRDQLDEYKMLEDEYDEEDEDLKFEDRREDKKEKKRRLPFKKK